MDTFNQQLAANIRAELARRRFTQKNLAHAIGINQATVSGRLRAESSFTVPELVAIADVLGMDAADLLPSRDLRASA